MSALKATDNPIVVIAAARLESLNSSAKYAVSTSLNEIVDVSEASITRIKNIVDHSDANGMPLNISGKVTNTSDGPSEGSIPALNTAGNITNPARTETKPVLLRDLRYLKDYKRSVLVNIELYLHEKNPFFKFYLIK